MSTKITISIDGGDEDGVLDEGADVAAATDTAKGDEPTGYEKFLTVAPGVKLARFAGADFIEYIGRRKASVTNEFRSQIYRIRVDRATRRASVWRDNVLLFEMRGGTAGPSTLSTIATSALRRLLKRSSRHCGKRGAGR